MLQSLYTLLSADLVEFLVHGAIQLHVVDNICPLTLIGCDDSNLLWLYSSLHQLGHHFLHVGSLRPEGRGRKTYCSVQFSLISHAFK